jgi:hypothetical protein
MTFVEKILILLVLVFALANELTKSLNVSWPYIIFTIFTVITMLVLCIYYLIQTKFSLYYIVFFLFFLAFFGGLLKIMHLPGAGIFMGLGLLTQFFIPWLLIKSGIQFYKIKKIGATFNFIVASLLTVQFIIIILSIFKDYLFFGQSLNYVLLLVILIMKIKGIVIKFPEYKILNIIALQSTLFILSDISKNI